MLRSLRHSHCSTVTAVVASSRYLKRRVFSHLKVFDSFYFLEAAPAAFPIGADASSSSVDSRRSPNSAVLVRKGQGQTKLVDNLRHKPGASIQLERAVELADLERVRRPTTPSKFSVVHSASQKCLEESVQAAIKVKNYQKLPELFNDSKEVGRNPNPFSFLSRVSDTEQINVVDEILQSLIHIRPRSRPLAVYSSLLSYVLEIQNSLPLALAIIQRILRSGCLPVPQTHLLLSKAWAERRRQKSTSVSALLLEMELIGYTPDCGTCNYLILSLCRIDQFQEAVDVLRGMGKACIPDVDSYGILIGELSEARKIREVVEMVMEMVGGHGLSPRKEMVLKVLGAMRTNREIWRAAELIEYLESEGVHVDFEAYELALEGCLEDRRCVLAGKVAVRMAGRGFIPYIAVRQRVVEGLVAIGEAELASTLRQRFADLCS
ncbi:pentatricopeptide repeat-containing protein At1g06270 [Andrographis paniculata]|uniref:pentatricopeptide repeat-containing protein At1g06270 n=1 Tax=Andrographis paniculata TaxID=175694 RepID=UPI0021E73DF8|nr:pentatricopeptide repeat-containing protein At1g06270 [Andrographis paniculata]XP_051139063.1 pentatricopeptide repeat-containing protein At1g06270 [Andrographis paniculata]